MDHGDGEDRESRVSRATALAAAWEKISELRRKAKTFELVYNLALCLYTCSLHNLLAL